MNTENYEIMNTDDPVYDTALWVLIEIAVVSGYSGDKQSQQAASQMIDAFQQAKSETELSTTKITVAKALVAATGQRNPEKAVNIMRSAGFAANETDNMSMLAMLCFFTILSGYNSETEKNMEIVESALHDKDDSTSQQILAFIQTLRDQMKTNKTRNDFYK